jgi:hypothetical protein
MLASTSPTPSVHDPVDDNAIVDNRIDDNASVTAQTGVRAWEASDEASTLTRSLPLVAANRHHVTDHAVGPTIPSMTALPLAELRGVSHLQRLRDRRRR